MSSEPYLRLYLGNNKGDDLTDLEKELKLILMTDKGISEGVLAEEEYLDQLNRMADDNSPDIRDIARQVLAVMKRIKTRIK